MSLARDERSSDNGDTGFLLQQDAAREHRVAGGEASAASRFRRPAATCVVVACCTLVAVHRGVLDARPAKAFSAEEVASEEDVGVEGGDLEQLYDAGCVDTPGWSNGWSGCAYSEVGKDPALCALTPGASWPSTTGYTCKFYEQKGLCSNGQYRGFAMGPGLNSPEQNCCACKGYTLAAECDRDTMGGCKWTGSCNGWRGPTSCISGKCMCNEGYCNAGGTCQQSSRAVAVRQKAGKSIGPTECSRKTSGSCFVGGCDFWRGATNCEMFKCVCLPGYCVDEFGGCFKSMGTIKAEVVPINAMQPRFPGGAVKTALAVSGGGSRALSAALGVFRALRDLGLLQNIDLISSVSGGSWASSILMFADVDLATLLGAKTNPSELILSALDATPPPLGAVVMTKINDIAIKLKFSGVPFGMLWVASVATAFLQPFGLNRFDAFMAPSMAAVAQIKQKNPQFQDASFTIPMPGRAKSIVMNSAVLAPQSYKASAVDVVGLQISPDFSGWPFYPNDGTVDYQSANLGDAPMSHVLIGGGMVSTYAFGSSAPTKRGTNGQKGGEDVEMQSPVRPMSLVRAVGFSSAAFGAQLTQIPGIGAEMNPRAEMWPITSDEHPRPQEAMRNEIGDGGNLENTGILAALQRGATNIVSMISSPSQIALSPSYCGSYVPTGTEITGQVSNMFGLNLLAGGTAEFHVYNQVFPTEAYVPLMCELQQLKASGKSLTLRKTMNVIANTWWGITPRQVDIIFIILDQSTNFNNVLPAETQQALASGPVGGLDGFPTFKTMFNNGLDLTSYTARQINLLSAQTEWMVNQNEADFKAVFHGGQSSGGLWR